MFTSKADVFRTRQAIRDLSEAAQISLSAVRRLVSTRDDQHVIDDLLIRGVPMERGKAGRFYADLLLAAAMPEEDFPCFTGATAILLVDLLRGGGWDDLYWNWEAFHDHYRLADPPVRAALMNGFRNISESGRVTLKNGPSSFDCMSIRREDLKLMLKQAELSELVRAIDQEISAEMAGEMWHRQEHGDLSSQALSGFRFLYERPNSMAPPMPEKAALIPWA
jgi:hypothetical protein